MDCDQNCNCENRRPTNLIQKLGFIFAGVIEQRLKVQLNNKNKLHKWSLVMCENFSRNKQKRKDRWYISLDKF